MTVGRLKWESQLRHFLARGFGQMSYGQMSLAVENGISIGTPNMAVRGGLNEIASTKHLAHCLERTVAVEGTIHPHPLQHGREGFLQGSGSESLVTL